jgi:hypothetical protein
VVGARQQYLWCRVSRDTVACSEPPRGNQPFPRTAR